MEKSGPHLVDGVIEVGPGLQDTRHRLNDEEANQVRNRADVASDLVTVVNPDFGSKPIDRYYLHFVRIKFLDTGETMRVEVLPPISLHSLSGVIIENVENLRDPGLTILTGAGFEIEE